MTELTIKGEVEVLRLRPGDAIVVTVDRKITVDQANTLREQVRASFPGHEVVILPSEIKLAVKTA